MKKYFIFDCETGGTSSDVSLLTVYGMVLNERLEPTDTINLAIKPTNGKYIVQAGAMAVNKINLIEHDKTAISEKEAAVQFYDFAFRNGANEKMIPIGHNVSMDIEFVKNHLMKDRESAEGNCWHKFFSYHKIDTATITQFLMLAGKLPNDLSGSLESLAKFFNLSYEKAHNAEFDTKLTLEILKRQIALIDNKAVYLE